MITEVNAIQKYALPTVMLLDVFGRLSHEAQKESKIDKIELGRELRKVSGSIAGGERSFLTSQERGVLDRKAKQVEQHVRSAALLRDENEFLIGQNTHLADLLAKCESYITQLTLDLEQAGEEKRFATGHPANT
jgi:hypothetical protein